MGAMGDSGGTELAISILQLLREMVRAIVRWRWQSFGVTGQAQGLPLRDCSGDWGRRFGWGDRAGTRPAPTGLFWAIKIAVWVGDWAGTRPAPTGLFWAMAKAVRARNAVVSG